MDEALRDFDERLRFAFEVWVARDVLTPEQADGLNGLLDEIDEVGKDEFQRRLEAILCHGSGTSART